MGEVERSLLHIVHKDDCSILSKLYFGRRGADTSPHSLPLSKDDFSIISKLYFGRSGADSFHHSPPDLKCKLHLFNLTIENSTNISIKLKLYLITYQQLPRAQYLVDPDPNLNL